uniref:Agenet-like domain-containing protein n=1 Tax=Tanacetum cinerariifolium TaxID=118510 RepID=A0A6L2L668_TANCI|nr:agenet-like domain-containing protein [Tanacetum cinerariifolium]
MKYNKGSMVEVLTTDEVPYHSWRCTQIVSSHGHSYTVRYNVYPGFTNQWRVEHSLKLARLKSVCDTLGKIMNGLSLARFIRLENLNLSKKEFAAEVHRLELQAYRCTIEALHASGPLTWEKETMVTNLRPKLILGVPPSLAMGLRSESDLISLLYNFGLSAPEDSEVFKVYFKGLLINDHETVEMSFGGIGVAISDLDDYCVLEVRKQVTISRDMEGDMVELLALIEGLNSAVELGIKRVQILCDNHLFYQYCKHMVELAEGCYHVTCREKALRLIEVAVVNVILESPCNVQPKFSRSGSYLGSFYSLQDRDRKLGSGSDSSRWRIARGYTPSSLSS